MLRTILKRLARALVGFLLDELLAQLEERILRRSTDAANAALQESIRFSTKLAHAAAAENLRHLAGVATSLADEAATAHLRDLCFLAADFFSQRAEESDPTPAQPSMDERIRTDES